MKFALVSILGFQESIDTWKISSLPFLEYCRPRSPPTDCIDFAVVIVNANTEDFFFRNTSG